MNSITEISAAMYNCRFNENQFHKDLQSNGIDPGIQLTRRQWNTIRRRVRKKAPRRFSRALIDMEFDELNRYRTEVRNIQRQIRFNKKHKPVVSNFKFEGSKKKEV